MPISTKNVKHVILGVPVKNLKATGKKRPVDILKKMMKMK